MELRMQIKYGNADTWINLATIMQTHDTTLGQQENIIRRRDTIPYIVRFAIPVSYFVPHPPVLFFRHRKD